MERDADGKFINNKWSVNDVSTSTTQSDWNDDYSGFGPDKYQYKYNSSASWIRSRINSSNGFLSWPWLYVNMKFRPHNGDTGLIRLVVQSIIRSCVLKKCIS